MIEPRISYKLAVDEYGGRRQLGQALGISTQAVQDWFTKKRPYMPKRSAEELKRINPKVYRKCLIRESA